MEIVAAEWIPYRLAFRRPWLSAAAALEERRGRLLKLVADNGLVGWGDCPPFPEIGISEAAAAAYARECARLDLEAQAAGLPLADWLGNITIGDLLQIGDWPDLAPRAGHSLHRAAELGRCTPSNSPRPAPRTPRPPMNRRRLSNPDFSKPRTPETPRFPHKTLAVNAALGDILALDPGRLRAACDAGFSVLKIKMGNADPQAELARLQALSALLPPGIAWRLDANRAWDEATAARFLAACAHLPVEGVEEPLRHPTPAALGRLQAGLPFPLALDESCHLVDADFLAAPPVRRLILKPPRHGGLLAARDFARAAGAAGLECVVTSSLESACGLTAAAHLATAVAPHAVHGLATAGWFLEDTGVAPAIREGRLSLPEGVGLGFGYGCRAGLA